MIGDIKFDFNTYKYPELDTTKDLDLNTDQILSYIEYHQKTFLQKFDNNDNYFIGKNAITDQEKSVDEYAPDNRVPVPYAKTMTQIVKGYMYKPSLITYDSNDEKYDEEITVIYERNNEPLKTAEAGEAQSKYGIGFELLYSEPVEDNIFTEIEKQDLNYVKNNDLMDYALLDSQSTVPMFASAKPHEIIPIFIRSLNKELYAFIRYYVIEKEDSKTEYKIEVYYNNRISIYNYTEYNGEKVIEFDRTETHSFGDVPLCIYINNEEYQADYEPVQPMIDAYDKLLSCATNEEDRFASAYLVLKNYILSNANDDNEKQKVLERLKKFRVFEVQDNGEIQFLTKEIPSDFIAFLKSTLREDIQYHSHVPDFRDKNFQSASGESMKWALFDFENFCADKQTYMEIGLKRRLKLINSFLQIKAVDISEVNIRFERNIPSNDTIQIDNVVKLKTTALLADEDLIPLLPRDMVPDPELALKNMEEQKKKNLEMFDLGDIENKGADTKEPFEDKEDDKESKS